MADKRPGRTGNELPAEDSRRKSPSSHSGQKPDSKKPGSSSQFRLVGDDDLFAGPHEPNDESPTIISHKPNEAVQAARGSNDLRGRRLAHFELGEPIGVGGMAAVLKARDTQLDRTVALKILPPEMAKDPENIRRFHQEARAAAKLDHENIARVFYCGEDQGLHFIAFEFVDGENLRTILESRGRIPVGEALRYVRQVATGLDHAGSRGVVHRDIKPSNIIITPTGKAKVVDMGLARSLEPHDDDGLTQSGVTLGTFDYISPEQALEPREADSRSDIYSLGCTLYHMLTGHPAVPEGTAAKKLHHHQHIAPTDPRQLNPEIPDDVALVLSKMMAKDPSQRYQRPMQLVQHLAQIGKRYDGESSQETFVDVIPVEPRSRPMLIVCVALLALAGLLFALSLAPNSNKKTDPPKIGARPTSIEKKPTVDVNKTVAPPAAVTVLRTEDDLQRAIDRAIGGEKAPPIMLEHDIELTGKLKLTGGAKSRPLVEIVGAERQPVKLTLTLDKAPASALAGLRVDGATVMFRNIRFEIVADGVKLGDVPVSSVALGSGGVAEFDQCVSSQSGLPLEASPKRALAASVFVDGSRGEAPRATFRDCAFLTGQTAVAVTGSGRVIARDCAFSSLSSLVYLKGGGGEPVVTLEHCSAYVKNGPVFRIDEDTACQINVDYSIFTVPRGLQSPEKNQRVLIRQAADNEAAKVSYRGKSNFYRLEGLWASGPSDNSSIVAYDSPAAFAEKGRRGSDDKNSQFLKLDDATFPFAHETARGDDFTAFQLSPLRELQTSERYSEHPMLGIRKFLGTTMTRLPQLVVEPQPMVQDYKPAPNEAVLEPEDLAGGRLPEGKSVFTLKPTAGNSEFLLKMDDIESDRTIRGFMGSTPTVRLAENKWRDPYLFRVVGGKLTLENLHLVIEPDREGRTSQSLVLMAGLGTCSLKNCIVTMKPRPGSKTALSVVTMNAAEKGEVMMNDPKSESVPTVVISDCYLRGDGDVLSLKESRPVSLQVSRSLAILGGSLLHQQQAAPKDVAGKEPPASDIIALRMSSSVFFFAEPLLSMQSGKVKPWYQHSLRIESAEQCLFTTLDDRPLVSLETLEAPEKLAAIFEWKGTGNAYAQFKTAPVLEQTSADSFHLDEAGWKETADRGSLFLPSGFKVLPTRPYHTAKPTDYVIRSESLDDLQSYMQLPRFQLPE